MALVKIINHVIAANEGDIVRAYGMDWDVRKDPNSSRQMMAVREMGDKTAKHWEEVGRVVILTPPVQQTKQPDVFDSLIGTPENYFGCDSAKVFRDKIKTYPQNALLSFADKMMGEKFPKDIGRDALIDAICNKAKELATKKGE